MSDTRPVLLGDELQELLKIAITTYVEFCGQLPGTDYGGSYSDCVAGACRDRQFPRLQCETCRKAASGLLGEPMRLLVQSRRANALPDLYAAAQLARAAHIDHVYSLIVDLHDLCVKAAATGAKRRTAA